MPECAQHQIELIFSQMESARDTAHALIMDESL